MSNFMSEEEEDKWLHDNRSQPTADGKRMEYYENGILVRSEPMNQPNEDELFEAEVEKSIKITSAEEAADRRKSAEASSLSRWASKR